MNMKLLDRGNLTLSLESFVFTHMGRNFVLSGIMNHCHLETGLHSLSKKCTLGNKCRSLTNQTISGDEKGYLGVTAKSENFKYLKKSISREPHDCTHLWWEGEAVSLDTGPNSEVSIGKGILWGQPIHLHVLESLWAPHSQVLFGNERGHSLTSQVFLHASLLPPQNQ